jgi:hypothetical protein
MYGVADSKTHGLMNTDADSGSDDQKKHHKRGHGFTQSQHFISPSRPVNQGVSPSRSR